MIAPSAVGATRMIGTGGSGAGDVAGGDLFNGAAQQQQQCGRDLVVFRVLVLMLAQAQAGCRYDRSDANPWRYGRYRYRRAGNWYTEWHRWNVA
jgi:hypothetical protein